MPTFADLIQQSTAHAWLFIPSAILLGALHGLEPGHSKTMMAAFVVAIRGTVRQAVLLGLCATLSHTAVVWVIALGGLYLWRGLAPETLEPYLQLASGAIVLAMGGWMIWRTRREQQLADAHHHDHDHQHHLHGHADPAQAHRIDIGHGVVTLDIVADGHPPRFRLASERGLHGFPGDVTVQTERPDGGRQTFAFRPASGGGLESVEEIPEPHEFMARLSWRHGDHTHTYDVAFTEHAGGDDSIHAELRGLDAAGAYQDAHELAHANDIRRRFAGRQVTTAQIAVFGLTGGLIPCPGAITVLLLCLQLKAFALGAVLVLCFSVGLALTMVSSGVIAALSVRHVSRRFTGFGDFVRRAPYASGALILLIGIYLGYSGWTHLPGR